MTKTWYRMIRFISIGLMVCGIFIPSHDGIRAQSGLPNDLTFLIHDDAGYALMLYDHQTDEIREFYRPDDASSLRPISWSPQGDLLVVWELYPITNDGSNDDYYAFYCTITLQGVRQVCFDSQAPVPSLGPYQEYYHITWSVDGEFVYFVTQEGSQRQLIEANVETGATERVIYELGYDGTVFDDGTYFWFPPTFIWTSDLQHVAVGVGDMEQTTRLLVNTETQATQDLSQIVSPWEGGLSQNMPDGTGIICRSFSPKNTYLTALNFSEEQLVIFDTSLNIVGTFDSIGCPTWGDDDDMIYYTGRTADNSHDYVYVYSIEEDRVLRRYDTPYVASSLVLSPDRSHIAFTAYVGGYKVNIIYPDGSIELLTDQFDRSDYPLWRPVSNQ